MCGWSLFWDKDKILGNLKCAFHSITWGSGQNNEREGKKEIEKEGKVSVKKKKKKVCEVEKGKVRSATAEERRKK